MGCMNIVIYLLQNEANPDVPTVRGETPLHLAARANQTDIIRILLRHGAQVDARARVSIFTVLYLIFIVFRCGLGMACHISLLVYITSKIIQCDLHWP